MLAQEMELHNKFDIIDYISNTISELKAHPTVLKGHSVSFFVRLIAFLNDVLDEIKIMCFPEFVDPRWFYDVEIRECGIRISISFVGPPCPNDIYLEDIGTCAEAFTLFERKCKLLTVEEYANIYEVSPITVRQWIRRGKIRTATKFGNEWRIPELTELTGRGYTEGSYYIERPISELSEEWKFINDYDAIEIQQEYEKKDTYKITLSTNEDERVLFLNQKEREKLEMILISSNDVKYGDDIFLNSY